MDLQEQLERYAYLLRPFFRDVLFMNRDMLMLQLKNELKQHSPDNLILKGFSVYSQNEEDGILNAIFRTLQIPKPTFFEFGVHPAENNSLYLLLNGSKGVWFDSALTDYKAKLGQKDNLLIIDEFISLANIQQLCEKGLGFLGLEGGQLDMLSLDLDGNDFYIVEKMLQTGIEPKVLCLEYNAKFPLPMDIKIKYDEEHRWDGGDYQGCSLQAYINLLKEKYTLLACNLSGSNCFFIKNDLAGNFVVYDPARLYMPCRYYLSAFNKGHFTSTNFLEVM